MKIQMQKYFSVGIGGIVGATIRYATSLLFKQHMLSFPYATLFVNLTGCFLLTFLLNHQKFKHRISPEISIGLTVGVLGSLTTFSTVTVEFIELWHMSMFKAITYILISLLGSFIFCILGYISAKK